MARSTASSSSSRKTASPDFQRTATLLHRLTALAIAFIGFPLFTLWLLAVSTSPENYALFWHYIIHSPDKNSFAFSVNIISRIIGVMLTWCFFYHVMSVIRLNTLKRLQRPSLYKNYFFYSATNMAALILTLLVWGIIFLGA